MQGVSNSNNDVAIVIVNWNGWRDSISCIETCLAQNYPCRIVLCDNASSDGSVERILAWARGQEVVGVDESAPIQPKGRRLPRGVAILDRFSAEAGHDEGAELVIVRTGANLGFAGANNVGLRWAVARNFEYVWLLNNDTVVPEDALGCLVDVIDTDPAIGLCGSLMIEYYDPSKVQACAGAVDLNNFRARHLGAGFAVEDVRSLDMLMAITPLRAAEAIYPNGASILVRRSFIEGIGLMEESYFLYYEEADWMMRGRPNYRVAISIDSRVYHKGGASAGKLADGLSTRSTGFLYRSRLIIAKRFAPARLNAVVLGILEEAARGLVRGRPARFLAAWRALTGQVHPPHQGRSPA